MPRCRGRDRNGDPHDPRLRPARCRRRRLCPGLRRRNESMGQTTPSTRPRWSGCSTPRSVRISRRGSSNTSGAASRVHPPSGPGLILPGRGTAPASTGPRSATTPSPSSCAADTTPLQVVAVYRTQRRSWRVMTEHVGALLDEYPGPAEHDATGGGQGRLPVKATAKRSRSTPPHVQLWKQTPKNETWTGPAARRAAGRGRRFPPTRGTGREVRHGPMPATVCIVAGRGAHSAYATPVIEP